MVAWMAGRYTFDDSRYRRIDEKDVCTKAAYVLFFQRVSNERERERERE